LADFNAEIKLQCIAMPFGCIEMESETTEISSVKSEIMVGFKEI
jgi:hypothetical protein